MLKQAQAGAEEVDRRLLSLVPSSDRKTLLEGLAAMAAQMDSIEGAEPEKASRKIRLRRMR
jgi:hypothetical protein